jgi:hypothetical protein
MKNPATQITPQINYFTERLKEISKDKPVLCQLRCGFSEVTYAPAKDGLPEGFRCGDKSWTIDGLSRQRPPQDIVSIVE